MATCDLRCHFLLALLPAVHFSSAQDTLRLEIVPWAEGIPLALDITHCGDDRLFVAQQYGAISIVTDSMVVLPVPFLDIHEQVLYNGERGLLGLAFDPGYAANGFFYVSYVMPGGEGTLRISRFHVSADPNIADPASEVVMISLPQTDELHKSGGLVFGQDGYLYVSIGDGGGANDPNGHGQDLTTIFGKVLRIKPEVDSTYSIPPDNPFANTTEGQRPEIWAYGFRNPFRIAIDPANGDLWMGDVGQQMWEEIDRWPGADNSAPNFGWRCYEGEQQFIFDADCSDDSTYVHPVVVKGHQVTGGNFCAIIAGEVYRGTRYPRMIGRHIYSDLCAGELRTLTSDGQDGWADSLGYATGMVGISSIGPDAQGELYVTNVYTGMVHKIRDRCPMDPPLITGDGNVLTATPGESYQWYFEGDTVLDATQDSLVATASGNYSVQVTFANGCVRTSAPYFHIITAVTGPVNGRVRVHPQPATTSTTMQRAGDLAPWDVSLHDGTGRGVKNVRWPSGAAELNLYTGDLRSGVFVLEITDDAGRVVHREYVAVVR